MLAKSEETNYGWRTSPMLEQNAGVGEHPWRIDGHEFDLRNSDKLENNFFMTVDRQIEARGKILSISEGVFRPVEGVRLDCAECRCDNESFRRGTGVCDVPGHVEMSGKDFGLSSSAAALPWNGNQVLEFVSTSATETFEDEILTRGPQESGTAVINGA